MQLFNIRVYGILIQDGALLVSDELIRGKQYTKFPGGGLEFGEGTRDCLKREFREEMDLVVEVGEHLYTTDYYQPSAFHPDHQIISIYYFAKPLEAISIRINQVPFEFDEAQLQAYRLQNETESFRFIPLQELSEESVTLPIDKIVVRLILDRFIHSS
jgi:ADP-ribose pyrophosphatase YjhB (NUDIX family)